MRLVVVPAVPALLPEHASLSDPVAPLRESCRTAVGWLVDAAPTEVHVPGAPPGGLAARVARSLLDEADSAAQVWGDQPPTPTTVMLVANGSARRGQKAPGHLDERSFDFDHALGGALKTGDLEALTELDRGLAGELLTAGLAELADFAGGLASWRTRDVLFDGDPYGVQYWVVTAECEF